MIGTSPRRTGGRQPKNVVLVVTEGETEKRYFEGLKQRGSNIEIVMIRSPQADPVRVVDLCVKKMSDNGMDISEGDIAICVFDVDENPLERIREAVRMAKDEGILTAISNPCFELWLLLHFGEVGRCLDRNEAIDLMREHIPNYSKTADHRQVLNPRRVAAIERSKKLQRKNGLTEPIEFAESNPSTNMHLAITAIDELVRRNQRS